MSEFENKENKKPINIKSFNISSKENDGMFNMEPKYIGTNNEDLLNEYKKKIEHYEEHIDKMKYEIKAVQQENELKYQCVRSTLEEKESDRLIIIRNIKGIKESEQKLLGLAKEIVTLQKEVSTKAKYYLDAEERFSGLVQKVQVAKATIDAYERNERNMLKRMEDIQKEILVKNAEHENLKESCNDQIQKSQEQIVQAGHEPYKREMAKLQSMVKRLEIKTGSLETALKQKSEECLALSGLYDDIAGKQPS